MPIKTNFSKWRGEQLASQVRAAIWRIRSRSCLCSCGRLGCKGIDPRPVREIIEEIMNKPMPGQGHQKTREVMFR